MDATSLVRPGAYVTDLGLVTVGADGGRLHLGFRDRGTELVALLDGTLRMADPPRLRLAFSRVEGQDLLLGVVGAVHERLGVRLPAPVPVPVAWRQRLGAYRVHDPYGGPAGAVELREVDGRLLLIERGGAMEPAREIVHVLVPQDDARARVAGLGRAGGSQVLVRDGTLHWRGLDLVRQR